MSKNCWVVLVSSAAITKYNNIDWVAPKQLKLIAHGSGGWKSEIRVPV